MQYCLQVLTIQLTTKAQVTQMSMWLEVLSPKKYNVALGGTPTYPSSSTETPGSSLSSKPTGGNIEAVISPLPPP